MFLEPVPKCSPRFSNIFLRTVYVWVFKFVDYPTVLKFVVPVLGCHEECFNIVCAFDVYLYSLVVAYPFEFLPYPLYIWKYYGDVVVVSSTVVIVVGRLIVPGMWCTVGVVLALTILL